MCFPPFVRLEGDYCGVPLSGRWILWAIVTEFAQVVARLATGAAVLTDLGRGLGLIAYGLLVVLPFFSIAAWGLAAGTGLLMAISGYPRLY